LTKDNESLYRQVATRIDTFLNDHEGESFDRRTVYNDCHIDTPEARHEASRKLSYEVKQGRLEKTGKGIFRYINTIVSTIDWVNASEKADSYIRWPYGVNDQSTFGFDGHVIVSPGDIVVIAGEGNTGKTTFCMNLLWENMDYFPCTLMGNEYTPSRTKRRFMQMNWRDPLDEHGKPKFELILRYNNWKDIIRPNHINIIDWINVTDNFYQIGDILEGIKSKLNKGVAICAIQKEKGKDMGRGGSFTMDFPILYLAMGFGQLKVVKGKEYIGKNLDNSVDGFELWGKMLERFDKIRPLKKCPKCKGFQGNNKCDICDGKGWHDA